MQKDPQESTNEEILIIPEEINQEENISEEHTTEDPQMAQINLDIGIGKITQSITNVFALTTLKIKQMVNKPKTPNRKTKVEKTEVETQEADDEEEFSTDLGSFNEGKIEDFEETHAESAEVEINIFCDKPHEKDKFEDEIEKENYTLELSSPGIKRYVKITSIISILQLCSFLFLHIFLGFGRRYHHHLIPNDLFWASAMVFSGTMMLKKFEGFRHRRKTTIVFFVIDSLICYNAYSYAYSLPTFLSLVFLASLTVSFTIFTLNSVADRIPQRTAFRATFFIYVVTCLLVFMVFHGAFREMPFGEKALLMGLFGYFAGLTAEARVRILGKRLELKDMSITLEDCIVIAVAGNVKGCVKSLGKTFKRGFKFLTKL